VSNQSFVGLCGAVFRDIESEEKRYGTMGVLESHGVRKANGGTFAELVRKQKRETRTKGMRAHIWLNKVTLINISQPHEHSPS
jgi:hypothetical protein